MRQSPQARLAQLKETRALSYAGHMVPTRQRIAGGALTLEPLTLHRWGLLVGTGNALVTGEPITFQDLRNYVWIHSPHFGQFNDVARLEVTRRLDRWLTPRWPNLEAALRLWSLHPRLGWLRRRLGPDRAARHTQLVETLREQITQAWHYMPTGGDDKDAKPGDALPCAYGAYLATLFPHWSPDTLESLPLTALAQYARAIIADRKGPTDLALLDPEEKSIWDDYLRDPLGRGVGNAENLKAEKLKDQPDAP